MNEYRDIYWRQSHFMGKICEQLDERCKSFDIKDFAPAGSDVHKKTEKLGGKTYEVVEWTEGGNG